MSDAVYLEEKFSGVQIQCIEDVGNVEILGVSQSCEESCSGIIVDRAFQ